MSNKVDSKKNKKIDMIGYLKSHWKVLIYTLSGLGLSWIDLWRGIGNGAQWALAINCTGFCIFPMIAFRLDWRTLFPKHEITSSWQKIFRIVFYSWTILFLICAYPVFRYFAPGTDYDAQIATAVLNAGLYGAVVIRMYFYLFFEKKNADGEKADHKAGAVFILWLAFMVLAIISVNSSIWPLWFLVMFGSFYLAPLKKGETEEIIEGLANGIIIGFFWIQSRAFLYRPYDYDHRYYGHYTNPNVNAMFYLYVYIAWLVKLTAYRIRNSRKMYAFTFFMASSMWIFEFFTGSRTAWLAFACVTFVYWFAEIHGIEKRFRTYISKLILMGLMALVAFLPVFACMRYIPALRHHPIWYQAEYSENKVMSWDPIDSPKYTSLGEAVYGNLGRLAFWANNKVDDEETDAEVTPAEVEVHEHEITFGEDGEQVLAYSDGIAPGSDALHPMYVNIDYERNLLTRALGVRYHIYRYIIGQIRLFGNREPYFVVWFIDGLPLGHAHNSILMMMYWFGPVAGLLFAAIMVTGFVSGVKSVRKIPVSSGTMISFEFALLVIAAFFLSGLTECTVFPGEYGLTMFFLALFPVVRKTVSGNPEL